MLTISLTSRRAPSCAVRLLALALFAAPAWAQADWLFPGGGCGRNGAAVLYSPFPPFLGITCEVHCFGEIGSPIFLYAGGSQSYAEVPLPLDIHGAAGQPCLLLTDAAEGCLAMIAVHVSPGGVGGEAWFRFPIPNNPALNGQHLMLQAFVVDHLEPAGFALASGMEAVLG